MKKILAIYRKIWYNMKDFARLVILRHGARMSGLSGKQQAEDSK